MPGAVNVAIRWVRAGGPATVAAGIGNAAAAGLTTGVTVNAAGASAPLNYAIPQLKGAPQVGATLTVSNDPGSWLNSPTSTSSKWQTSTTGTGSWSDIAGATGSSYTIVSGDVGKYIRRLTTATNASGSTDSGSSAWGPIVASTSVPLLKSDSVTYLGNYGVNLVGSPIVYVNGLAIRRVGGDLRLIIQILDSSVTNKNIGQFWELSLSGKNYGDNITNVTNKWAVGSVDVYGGSYASKGMAFLNWDEANDRMLLSQAVDYSALEPFYPAILQSFTLTDGSPVGTASDVKAITIGTIVDRRIYSGVTHIPAALQSDWGVGPYAVGFGGYSSTESALGQAALGLSMYAIPDYSTYANGSTIPDANIKALAARGVSPNGRANNYGYGFVPDGGSTPAFSGYPSGVPTGTLYGRGPINYLSGGDYRQNPPRGSRPNFAPINGGNANYRPDAYNWGRWSWSGFSSGAFINGTNQRAFCTIYNTYTGQWWYEASASTADGSMAELHLFNPDQIKEIVNGTRQASNIEPYATLPLFESESPPGLVSNHRSAIDPVGNRIYILRTQDDKLNQEFGRLYVYQINNV
jgi:hypothetical protein